jgi:hypothetical protein
MTRPVFLALSLWLLFAAVVYSVTSDRQTKAAGRAFALEQLGRFQHGERLSSSNDGFRPSVRAIAARSGAWFLAIAGTGAVATALAARRT